MSARPGSCLCAPSCRQAGACECCSGSASSDAALLMAPRASEELRCCCALLRWKLWSWSAEGPRLLKPPCCASTDVGLLGCASKICTRAQHPQNSKIIKPLHLRLSKEPCCKHQHTASRQRTNPTDCISTLARLLHRACKSSGQHLAGGLACALPAEDVIGAIEAASGVAPVIGVCRGRPAPHPGPGVAGSWPAARGQPRKVIAVGRPALQHILHNTMSLRCDCQSLAMQMDTLMLTLCSLKDSR